MSRKQRKSTSITPPPPKTKSSTTSMMDSLKQGFGFGAGIEMARSLIGSIFSKEESLASPIQDKDSISEECKPLMRYIIECKCFQDGFCDEEINAYRKCIKERN